MKFLKYNKGQVMILTVTIITSAIMSAAALTSLLMTYQIRNSTNIRDSLQAIMSADSGVEWELYRLLVDSLEPKPLFTTKTEFISEVDTESQNISIRTIGCSGAILENKNSNIKKCNRLINRSLEFFLKVI